VEPKGPSKATLYGQAVRQAGAALAIPGLLLAGPLVGYALGWAAQTYLGAPPWSRLAGLILGLVSGIRESILVIKTLMKESDE
jgi:F0F1-type ATP synthase assembly protein I